MSRLSRRLSAFLYQRAFPIRSLGLILLAAFAFTLAPHAQTPSAVSLTTARWGHTATALPGGRILVAGGANQNGLVGSTEILDLAGAQTSAGPPLLSPRLDHTATLLANGLVLIAGGTGATGPLASTELFDPASGRIVAGPPMTVARAGHTATVLANGSVLIAGGDAEGSAEVYRAGSGFSATGGLGTARSGHGAALLADGSAMVAGGATPAGTPLNSVEIYSPADHSFVRLDATMQAARIRPVLNVLPDGKVQIIGGDAAFSMEMFDPDFTLFKAMASLPPLPSLLSATLATDSRRALLTTAIGQNGNVPASYGWALNRDGFATAHVGSQAVVIGGAAGGQALGSGALFPASSASVTTDFLDYNPGSPVAITGNGWTPGETVTLLIHQEPQMRPDTTLTAVADGTGAIKNYQFATVEVDLHTVFTVTATGSASGYAAQTAFADAELLTAEVAGTANDVTVEAGKTANFTISVTASGNIANTVTTSAPSTATVRTQYSINNAGALSSSTPSSSLNFFASSNCNSGNCVVTWTNAPTAYPVAATIAADPQTPVGSYQITLSASANTVAVTNPNQTGAKLSDATATSITVHVVAPADSLPPVITVPSPITVEATGASGAIATYVATATDNVDGSLTPDCSPVSGSVFPLGTTTVNCTATDKAGNTGHASFTVKVQDTTPPTVTPPANVTAEATGPTGAAVSYGSATAADLVDGPVSAACLPASGSTFPLGTTSVTCSATDAAGNTGHASFTVKVQDTTPPTVTPPANVTAEATGPTGAAVSYGSATAADLVDGPVSAACLPASGSTFPLGTTSVTCSATDAAGNTGHASFTVKVQDTTPPTVTPPANVTAEATGPTGAAVSYGSATATDLVDGLLPATCLPASGSTFPLGTTSVTCAATDKAGNAGHASFTVKVQDTTPPALTVPGGITNLGSGSTGAIVNFSASAADLVDGPVGVTCTPSSGSLFPYGQTNVTCQATDKAGNQAAKGFTVKVQYQSGGICLGSAGHQVLQPINVDGSSVFKQGSTTPVKFRVCDANGISIGTPGVVASFNFVNYIGGTVSTVNEPIASTTPDSSFRWDPTAQQWIFNVSTKPWSPNATYYFQIVLNDGTSIPFQYGLR